MDFVKFVFTNLIYLFNKTLSFFEVLRNSKIAIVGRVSIDLILVNLISYFCYGEKVHIHIFMFFILKHVFAEIWISSM